MTCSILLGRFRQRGHEVVGIAQLNLAFHQIHLQRLILFQEHDPNQHDSDGKPRAETFEINRHDLSVHGSQYP